MGNSNIVCPFCKEGDFDLIGLKMHFNYGYCDIFNSTPTSDPPQDNWMHDSDMEDR